MKNKVIHVRTTAEIYKLLKKYCQSTGLTISQAVHRAIELMLRGEK